MSYVGWPTNVNKIILDNCKSTVGKGAVIKDSLENGGKDKSRMSCANPSDEFSVEMDFDWNTKDSNGLTEKDRFLNWYKYTLCYSQNSFYFPSILLNSNNSTGEDTEQVSYGKSTSFEWYRIVSEPEFTKSGMAAKCTMTWKTEATGLIEIPSLTSVLDHIECTNGYIDAVLTSTPSSEPTPADFSVTINSTATSVKGVFDGVYTERLYFDEVTASGTYTVSVSFDSGAAAVGTFTV